MKLQVIFPHAAAIFMMAVAGSSLAGESPGAEQAKDLLNKAPIRQIEVPIGGGQRIGDYASDFHRVNARASDSAMSRLTRGLRSTSLTPAACARSVSRAPL